MGDGKTDRWAALLPPVIRKLPADLATVYLLVVATVLSTLLPGVRESALRLLLALPMLLFLPGYATVAALFPERDQPTVDGTAGSTDETSGITGIERVVLSFGLSIAVVPLFGLFLNFTPFGLRFVPVLGSVSGFTIVVTATAARRRQELPASDQFRVPYHQWVTTLRASIFDSDIRGESLVNAVLICSVLLAVGSVGFALTTPKTGQETTEFYLLTESENGTLVADDYPTTFRRNQNEPLVVGVRNLEHRQLSYTVVVKLQRVQRQGNASQVVAERTLNRFETPPLAHNETWRRHHEVTPTLTGERLRLRYLLFVDDSPTDPTAAGAHRHLHLWINVSGA